MKTRFYLNGKETTKRVLEERFGEEAMQRVMETVMDNALLDPLETQSFRTDAGLLTVEFE